MRIIRSIPDVRKWADGRRHAGRKVALVPTMGALHAGHGSCISIAAGLTNTDTIVSIFVNPTQFSPGEDYDAYPKNLEADAERCAEWGAVAVFAPEVEDVYPEVQQTWVTVDGLDEHLCGASRPGHFRGVATVVAKLLNMVGPDVAVFGQKDAQQALILRRMAVQLNMPVSLRLSPIVRESDGLALSSRNVYLDPDERGRALGLQAGLAKARELLAAGERDPGRIIERAREMVERCGATDIEYLEFRKIPDLSALGVLEGRVILAIAARVGTTRLIDNAVFDVAGSDVSVVETMF